MSTAANRSRPVIGRLTPARVSPPTRRSLLKGVLAYRWLTAVWAFGIFVWQIWIRGSDPELTDVAHPWVGVALGLAAIALTGSLNYLYQLDPDRLLRPVPVFSEIALGAVMLVADAWIFGGADHPQTLPSIWVVGSVAAVAIAGGRRAAVTTGLGMGVARWVGLVLVVGPSQAAFRGLSTMVLLAVSGWVIGYLLRRLAETDRAISAYRAREEVARTLHDGVLQTLAVIQRRSDDEDLVGLARAQEHELREFLFGAKSVDADLATGLRVAARRAEERYGMRVQVICAPDLPEGDGELIGRVTGAVGEALTNAAKHGGAVRATIYAEPYEANGHGGGDSTDGGVGQDHDATGQAVFVSVKDDGSGFDPGAVVEGEGLTRSIRGRVAEIGGRVEIDGRPGRGTEVRMWV